MPSSERPTSQEFDWEALRDRLHTATTALSTSAANVDEAAILAERARLLARPSAASAQPSQSLDVVRFSICDEQYAIESRVVREVIAHPTITPVPNTPPLLRGIYNLRGQVLPVMDLRTLLNIPLTTPIDEWLIVLGERSAEYGIVVHETNDVAPLPLDQLLRPDGTASAGGSLIRGVTADALAVLDGDALLRDPRLSIDVTANRG